MSTSLNSRAANPFRIRSIMPLILLLLTIGICPLACEAETAARVWKDMHGRAVPGELVDFDGTTASLKIQGRVTAVRADQLIEADQVFLREWLGTRKADRERQTADAAKLRGVRQKVAISARWAANADGYLKGPFGDAMRKFHTKERSIVDDPKKGVFMSVEESLVWPEGKETMTVCCPENYDGKEPFGVLIYVSAGNQPVKPLAGWDTILAKHRLIYVSASGTGNDQPDLRRMALSLDAVATLRKEFKTDPARLYVSGISGGGAISHYMAVSYPEIAGAIDCCRGSAVISPYTFPFLTPASARTVAQRGQRFAFLSGPKDRNFTTMQAHLPEWKKYGFDTAFFSREEQGHHPPPAELFEEAVAWATAGKRRDSAEKKK